MLIKNRLKRIDDTIFFTNISSYFFNVDGLFSVDKMFSKEFANDSISKVSFDNELSNSEFFTSFEDIKKGVVSVSDGIRSHFMEI